MKMILAIVSKEVSGSLTAELIKEGHPVTTLASTGGFLKAGNATLLIVTEDEKIDSIKNTIEVMCPKETKVISSGRKGPGEEITVGGATMFVVDVETMVKV